MIKAIIFDFDGVIHDTFEISYSIIKKITPEITRGEYKDYFNGNIYKHKEVSEERVGKFFKIQNVEFKKLKIRKEIKKELSSLSDKYKLFIVSSNMELALSGYFNNNGITDVFKEVLGLESHKSKHEKFKILFEKYNLNLDNCVFITDTLGDIMEAKRVGVKCIAVDFGFHERERLGRGKPYKIISNFSQIKEVIKTIK